MADLSHNDITYQLDDQGVDIKGVWALVIAEYYEKNEDLQRYIKESMALYESEEFQEFSKKHLDNEVMDLLSNMYSYLRDLDNATREDDLYQVKCASFNKMVQYFRNVQTQSELSAVVSSFRENIVNARRIVRSKARAEIKASPQYQNR